MQPWPDMSVAAKQRRMIIETRKKAWLQLDRDGMWAAVEELFTFSATHQVRTSEILADEARAYLDLEG